MKSNNRKNWTKNEDRHLTELMRDQTEPVDWEELSLNMHRIGYSRNSKQIKSRWSNNLNPNLVKEKWSKSEILKLFMLFDSKGNRWQDIATLFSGRTDNCIKNQLFSSVRKGLRSIVKELGLDTGFSYTTMINQIKPKILANFLLQKISIKAMPEADEAKETNASDLIKTYVFRSRNIYDNDQIYENREVIQAYLQILMNMNNEYIESKKISKARFQSNLNTFDSFTAVENKQSITKKKINNTESNDPVFKFNTEETNFKTRSDNNNVQSIDSMLQELKSELFMSTVPISNFNTFEDLRACYQQLFTKARNISEAIALRLSDKESANVSELVHLHGFLDSITFNEPVNKVNFVKSQSNTITRVFERVEENIQQSCPLHIVTDMNSIPQFPFAINKDLFNVKKIVIPQPLYRTSP